MEQIKKVTKGMLWASYILQGIIVALLLMGASNNLLQTEMAVNGAMEMGYPQESVFYLGVLLFIAILLYAIPRSTFFGALLLTAWFGGAIATHVIHQDPWFNLLMPVIFAFLVWLSIGLRNKKLRLF